MKPRSRAVVGAFALASVLWLTALPVGARPRGQHTYLAELALVLEGTRRTLSWTERYLVDGRLAKFAHPLAQRYVELAGRMTPPGKLRLVHPHLLRVVENVELAVEAASRGNLHDFRQWRRVVREELRTLEGILKILKMRLPELAR